MSADRKPPTAAETRTRILHHVDSELDRVKAAEAEQHSLLRQVEAEGAQLLAEHDRAAAQARAAYKAPPLPPQLPDGRQERNALTELLQARQRLLQARTAALAGGLPDVEAAWVAARPALDGRAREIAEQAEALAVEYASWHALILDSRRAAETGDPNHTTRFGASTRMRARPDAHAVLDAAQGADLCSAKPVPRFESGVSGMEITARLDAVEQMRAREARLRGERP